MWVGTRNRDQLSNMFVNQGPKKKHFFKAWFTFPTFSLCVFKSNIVIHSHVNHCFLVHEDCLTV